MDPTSVAPHSLDAERAVLGALLLSDRWMGTVRVDERLTPDDFYREQHGQVFAAMLSLHDESRPLDVLTVEAAMRDAGHGSDDTAAMVDELCGYAPSAGHVREYARIVRDLSIRRTLLTASHEMRDGALARDRPLTTLIAEAEARMLQVVDETVTELSRIDPAEEVARIEGVRDGVEVVGVSSGFVDLDALTSGFHGGNLIILAARPSMGKSALVVNFAENMAAKGTGVAMFSLEMSRNELLRRMLASRAGVSGGSLLRGPLPPHHWEKVERAVDEVGRWPIYVDEGVDAGVLDIRVKARRLAARRSLGLIIVDYVQLMRADANAENRNVEVGKITRGLKLLAKELNVPVIAVSQLSRAVEHRQDKHPVLSDLRDSGSVEQDADVVLFLYRDVYYNEDTEEPDVGELVVAKHRNGPLGKVKLTFMERYPKFVSYAAQSRFEVPVGVRVDDDGGTPF